MNRAKIKNDAKKMIEGNLWTILKPALIVIVISTLAGGISSAIFTDDTFLGQLCTYLISLATMPLSYGLTAFILKFVRKEEVEYDEVFKYYSKFVPIFLLGLLMYIFIGLWSLLFVIPGIIAAISYSQAMYIMIDGEEEPGACIKKSKEMMYGYKWDYFVFMLSFFGWYLLCALTMGIALVYVAPYVSVSEALYYEELKKITKN